MFFKVYSYSVREIYKYFHYNKIFVVLGIDEAYKGIQSEEAGQKESIKLDSIFYKIRKCYGTFLFREAKKHVIEK